MEDVNNGSVGIARGAAVVIVLHSPREQYWGIIDGINTAGVFLRGLDLNAFDDWLAALVHNEPFAGFGDLFFPMWRVERISRDESSSGIPSFCDQFEHRTGRSFAEFRNSD